MAPRPSSVTISYRPSCCIVSIAQVVRNRRAAGAEDLHGAGGVEQSTDNQDDDVAAEDQDGVWPANNMRNREHEEHRAQQQLVGNGVKVLAQGGLLFQHTSQQAVQPV